jgi:hypothetical protein
MAVSRRGIAISRRGTDLQTTILPFIHYEEAVYVHAISIYIPLFTALPAMKGQKRRAFRNLKKY